MAGAADSQAQKTANLARIRDNQRRSRARRKEYLQELEVKYRHCEQTGVAASAEIQAAARKVIDENRRLRQLLQAKGVPDAEVEHATSGSSQSTTAADNLETMLSERRPCSPEDASNGGAGCGPRDCSSGCGTAQPLPSAKEGQRPLLPQPAQEGTPIPQHVSAESSQYPSPVSSSSTGPFAPQPPPQNQPVFTMAEPLLLPPAGMSQPQQVDFDWMNAFTEQQYWPTMPEQDPNTTGIPAYQDQHQNYALPQPSDTCSCQVAAETIRTIKPEAGHEVETELGCWVGEECQVSNEKVFGIMTRYSDRNM